MTGNTIAIGCFVSFIALTLAVTAWAARRTGTAEEFLTAGGRIGAGQNGFALAGDYLSAAAFLGIAGIVSAKGADGLIYGIGWLASWPVLLLLVAEPLRNLGRFTFADVVSYRLAQRPVRSAAAVSTLCVVVLYLVVQMVAAGSLVELLFGLPYAPAVIFVGAMMLVYVLFGGMLATTWVQIIKAALLLAGGTILAGLVLFRFGMNPLHLFAAAASRAGTHVLQPGANVVAGGWDTISLAIALIFGTAGMPHILMRVFTVPDVRRTRMSILYATGLIGFFQLCVLIIGFGGMVLVGPGLATAAGEGANMAAPLLARSLGGDAFFGFICAVSFATMLAVVAGLTLTGAATLSHDVWGSVVRGGAARERETIQVARIASVVLAVIAVLLGLMFQGENVAFMAGLAHAVACSANLPALVLSIYWRRLTTAGAVASILTGAVSAMLMIALSPTVQVDILGRGLPELAHCWWFVSLRNPAIVSMPLAVATGVVVSLLTANARERASYGAMRMRVVFGARGKALHASSSPTKPVNG